MVATPSVSVLTYNPLYTGAG